MDTSDPVHVAKRKRIERKRYDSEVISTSNTALSRFLHGIQHGHGSRCLGVGLLCVSICKAFPSAPTT
ncbi:hypothetical protein CYMTET_29323 [Cymbomonas tetramitiformis]|uniref:Uncharacterized protein n=1 Tax=Cymbomonas tetramitiformis TaxID=36881 RepID=A0AAE0FL82_9CHLO|nr:hypothetical protein CYMTET_29323 [Cymbomonas tetramitiformis]